LYSLSINDQMPSFPIFFSTKSLQNNSPLFKE
jgi:hypothetical protein